MKKSSTDVSNVESILIHLRNSLAMTPQLALDVFKQNPQLYDLILIDVKMEEMDGRFVYNEIKQIHPKANVLIFTGLDLNVDDFRNICPSFSEKQVIHKPVRMSVLVKTVKEALKS